MKNYPEFKVFIYIYNVASHEILALGAFVRKPALRPEFFYQLISDLGSGGNEEKKK